MARNADAYARNPEPVRRHILVAGYASQRAMAAELNRRGMMTRHGGRWQVSNVLNLMLRLDMPPR